MLVRDVYRRRRGGRAGRLRGRSCVEVAGDCNCFRGAFLLLQLGAVSPPGPSSKLLYVHAVRRESRRDPAGPEGRVLLVPDRVAIVYRRGRVARRESRWRRRVRGGTRAVRVRVCASDASCFSEASQREEQDTESHQSRLLRVVHAVVSELRVFVRVVPSASELVGCGRRRRRR